MNGKESIYPRIHLSIDNCFAIKRWVRPRDWMGAVKEIGNVFCIEASTDNEMDPLFNTAGYRKKWVQEVKACEKAMDLKVVSLYSGYATYRTTGLAHWDKSSREKLKNIYFKKTVDVACEIQAQVGNTLSAFAVPTLNDPALFARAEQNLRSNLGEMAKYAAHKGVAFSYEQMYTPGQGFWTIDGCRNWMKNIYKATKQPMYITIDTGHQIGQKHFIPPTDEDIRKMIASRSAKTARLGKEITRMIESGYATVDRVRTAIDRYQHLFSKEEDGNVYSWFSQLGGYSPIVHLQQTDGTYTGHKPFTSTYNAAGIIKPEKIFRSIAECYQKAEEEDMPPRVKDIFLTFELFFSAADSEESIIESLRESVDYWRCCLPQDGMSVDELI